MAGLLNNDVWLENARRANERAKMLAEKLTAALGMETGVSVRGERRISAPAGAARRAPARPRLAFLQICRTRHLPVDVLLVGDGKRY
jgi:hypothetical protein